MVYVEHTHHPNFPWQKDRPYGPIMFDQWLMDMLFEVLESPEAGFEWFMPLVMNPTQPWEYSLRVEVVNHLEQSVALTTHSDELGLDADVGHIKNTRSPHEIMAMFYDMYCELYK